MSGSCPEGRTRTYPARSFLRTRAGDAGPSALPPTIDAMAYAAVTISLLALAFTITSFWWLHARQGSLTATRPRGYAFASAPDKVRLRLPLAFFNTGAQALIVSDLRVIFDDEAREALPWITTRSKLRPEKDDGFAFATPFAVQGRGTRELIVEFGREEPWGPQPGSSHRLRLQAQLHPAERWIDVTTFDWWAPSTAESMSSYIAHRNEPAG